MKKTISIIVFFALLFSTVTTSFANTSKWAVDSVAIAEVIGLTDADKSYSYTNPISREDFCELICNLVDKTDYFENWYNEQTKNGTQKIPPFSKKPFEDTPNYAVNILYNHNIVYGKTPTTFAPDDSLTREEAATIIVRMINIVQPLPATAMYCHYDDIEQVSEWATESIQTISNLGFMNGVGDNNFAPKDMFTAEQAIAVLLRVYNGFKSGSLIKFTDKNGNIILDERDITSCNKVNKHTSTDDGWSIEIILTNEGREKLKKATKHIVQYAGYMLIVFDNTVVSSPSVMTEIDCESVIVTGIYTEEIKNAINKVVVPENKD